MEVEVNTNERRMQLWVQYRKADNRCTNCILWPAVRVEYPGDFALDNGQRINVSLPHACGVCRWDPKAITDPETSAAKIPEICPVCGWEPLTVTLRYEVEGEGIATDGK